MSEVKMRPGWVKRQSHQSLVQQVFSGFLMFSGYDQVIPWLRCLLQVSSSDFIKTQLRGHPVYGCFSSMIKLRYWGHFIIIVVGKISFDGMIPHPALR